MRFFVEFVVCGIYVVTFKSYVNINKKLFKTAIIIANEFKLWTMFLLRTLVPDANIKIKIFLFTISLCTYWNFPKRVLTFYGPISNYSTHGMNFNLKCFINLLAMNWPSISSRDKASSFSSFDHRTLKHVNYCKFQIYISGFIADSML